ncbi:hypothetical protein [Streptomyces vinaceus]|uniref:hypothetical protein n=1 Tax=Streptomyces vinaceus TaxID=1960 RepID=UPI00368234B5
MLTLLLVAGGLAAWTLVGWVVGLLVGRAVRHGEEQARQPRHSSPHAAYWGTDRPYPTPTPPARQTGRHARTDRHGEHR